MLYECGQKRAFQMRMYSNMKHAIHRPLSESLTHQFALIDRNSMIRFASVTKLRTSFKQKRSISIFFSKKNQIIIRNTRLYTQNL